VHSFFAFLQSLACLLLPFSAKDRFPAEVLSRIINALEGMCSLGCIQMDMLGFEQYNALDPTNKHQRQQAQPVDRRSKANMGIHSVT
jgi:hypothetical protein